MKLTAIVALAALPALRAIGEDSAPAAAPFDAELLALILGVPSLEGLTLASAPVSSVDEELLALILGVDKLPAMPAPEVAAVAPADDPELWALILGVETLPTSTGPALAATAGFDAELAALILGVETLPAPADSTPAVAPPYDAELAALILGVESLSVLEGPEVSPPQAQPPAATSVARAASAPPIRIGPLTPAEAREMSRLFAEYGYTVPAEDLMLILAAWVESNPVRSAALAR